MIENKLYKINLKINDNYKHDFNIPDDYNQYVYVNFVTQDIKCYLHDGSYADPTIYNKDTDVSDPDVKRRHREFHIIMMLIFLSKEYSKYFEEGYEYIQSHPDENIVMAQWVQDIDKEQAEHENNDEPINIPSINVDINGNNDTEYYILPFSMNEDAYKRLYETCSSVIMKHDNWIEENRGYGYDNMLTEYKNSWFYVSNDDVNIDSENNSTDDDNNTDNSSAENKSDNIDSNVKAILTIGFMSDKLILNVRFIMVGGRQLNQPSDVSMMMPFVKPELSSSESKDNASNSNTDNNENGIDNELMQLLCEQVESKLDGFITMLMSTVDNI